VSKVTEKIKTRSKPTPSENLNSHPLLGIHDLFGTELAMIFSFHVGLTDSVMQRMQFFFFLLVSVRHFLATGLPDLLF
jgi:hypothetical protein